MTRAEAIYFLRSHPYLLGHMLGFTKLTEIHNSWMVDMINGRADKTLQAHRGSYKTTCVSIALAVILVLHPNRKVLFMRKTDEDVKEVVAQVQKILNSVQMRYFISIIYGVTPEFTVENATELSTSLTSDIKGTSQLTGLGTKSSITGKHFDDIFTDDIVNKDDRFSRAERERTKLIYQELRNIVNRGGRIYNTGTPWHKDDAFTLMPNPEKWDCYSTGLIDGSELAKIREGMTASLFAANYELKHIAAEDVIFTDPNIGADNALAEQGDCHIDAAYGGEDYTALTICRKRGENYYIFGKAWQKHVDDCLDEIIKLRKEFNAGVIACENNADKGYLAKYLRERGERVYSYHEDMNKFVKITTYLKRAWKSIYFTEGTDKEYMDLILEYNENAEHDDAPDSAASIIRKLCRKSGKEESGEFNPYL